MKAEDEGEQDAGGDVERQVGGLAGHGGQPEARHGVNGDLQQVGRGGDRYRQRDPELSELGFGRGHGISGERALLFSTRPPMSAPRLVDAGGADWRCAVPTGSENRSTSSPGFRGDQAVHHVQAAVKIATVNDVLEGAQA